MGVYTVGRAGPTIAACVRTARVRPQPVPPVRASGRIPPGPGPVAGGRRPPAAAVVAGHAVRGHAGGLAVPGQPAGHPAAAGRVARGGRPARPGSSGSSGRPAGAFCCRRCTWPSGTRRPSCGGWPRWPCPNWPRRSPPAAPTASEGCVDTLGTAVGFTAGRSALAGSVAPSEWRTSLWSAWRTATPPNRVGRRGRRQRLGRRRLHVLVHRPVPDGADTVTGRPRPSAARGRGRRGEPDRRRRDAPPAGVRGGPGGRRRGRRRR